MPPLSGQDGVETFTATLEKESVVTAKVLALSEESKEPESEIVRFFAGKNVLITGGTGYLGRVLIHKLLSHCPDIGSLYLLMREKKGATQPERLEEMKAHFLFRDIEEKIPGQLRKIKAVQGDVSQIGLGLSDRDRSELKEEINVVFHSAASIKFDDELSKAVSMNVRGTKELMDLAKGMGNLESFVHVSTCYSHCHLRDEVIQEKIYPPESLSVKEVLEMSRSEISDEEAKRVIGERPNTYTFTKAITEQLVREERADLPISIVRPSIVVGARSEPLPGWVDNINGPTGVGVFISQGVLRSMINNPNLAADIVPVDTVINLMCAVAHKTARQHDGVSGERPAEVPVYNCNSSTDNPVTWGELWKSFVEACYIWPSETAILPPSITLTRNKVQDRVLHVFLNLIPAHLIDWAAHLQGRKPARLVRRMGRLQEGIKVLEFFANRQWSWANDNVAELSEDLNSTDRSKFNFRLHDLDWREYIFNYYLAVRTHVLKNKPETVAMSRRRLSRKVRVYNLGRGAVVAALSLCAAWQFGFL